MRILSTVTKQTTGDSASTARGPIPCAWCGRPVDQPTSGRQRKYCRRSCRQRAYEHRLWNEQHNIPAGSVVLNEAEAAAVTERIYLLRCAAEDLQIAVDEGAPADVLTRLANELVESARDAERLR